MNVEYLDNERIWSAADDFRTSADLTGHNIPPIDVMYVADVRLRFDVIEIEGMFEDLGMDAAIVPAEKAMYVDRYALDQWESKSHWIERRLRFTVAHELGHFVLHNEYLKDLSFKDVAGFKRCMLEHRKNTRLEDQANEFAGRFLVPADILRDEYNRYCQRIADADAEWRAVPGMREHLAKKIAPRFGTNHQVIETRFDHEGLWPLE